MAVKYAGVDISRWQTNVDYEALAKATIKGKPVKFAIIRAAAGTSEDSLFKKHVEGCLKAGLNVGVYVYSYATTVDEAKAEAEFVISLIKKYNLDGKLTYPIVYDLEEASTATLSKKKYGGKLCTDMTKAFCETIESYNYYPMIYTNFDWLFWSKHIDYDQLKKWPFWVAGYIAESRAKPYMDKITVWQHSVAGNNQFDIAGIGSVQGVPGQCDCNWAYVGLAAQIKKLGKNKFKKTAAKKTTYTLTAKAENQPAAKRAQLEGVLKANGIANVSKTISAYNIGGKTTGLTASQFNAKAKILRANGFKVSATKET